MEKQLGLFQPLGSYETTIFNQAKKSKEIVQNLYKNFNFVSELPDEILGILNIKVDIDQIRDVDSPTEPSTPKMFIWQFIPTVTLENKEDVLFKFNDELSFQDLLEPKIIPKWINTLFTTKSFTKGDFLMFTKQYFTLELMLKLLSPESIYIKKINEQIEKHRIDKLLIFLDCKLFSDKINDEPEALIERDILYKINNFNSKIKNIQRNNWYIIGVYDDFTSKNDLLLDLHTDSKIIQNRKKELNGSVELYSFVETFHNDYLFLNNAEFFNQKCNSFDWNSYIVSPTLLLKDFSSFDEKKLIKNNYNEREIYVYMKKEEHGSFFRSDILFPNKQMTRSNLMQVITVAKDFKHD
jgi:hypothetical protein